MDERLGYVTKLLGNLHGGNWKALNSSLRFNNVFSRFVRGRVAGEAIELIRLIPGKRKKQTDKSVNPAFTIIFTR